jgi:hypothetical protein
MKPFFSPSFDFNDKLELTHLVEQFDNCVTGRSKFLKIPVNRMLAIDGL